MNALEVRDLRVRYGDQEAIRGVSFSVAEGELLTLLGPSGCGKTTALRAIAGLETPFAGEIILSGRTVFSATEKLDIPVERRGLSMVFQSYGIWPHMRVFDNVAYGLRLRRLPRAEVHERVMDALRLVGLEEFAQRPATALSGGQQQRVALARSFVFHPRLLLFDEPLSNLDAKLRAEMRIELKDLQAKLGITSLYVTHDQEEAMVLSDRIAVMSIGVIEQIGAPLEVYNSPGTRFVAEFMGAANLIRGRLRPEPGADSTLVVETRAGELIHCGRPAFTPPPEPTVSIRTGYIDISRTPDPARLNCWKGVIIKRVFLGDFVQYWIKWGGDEDISIRKTPTTLYAEGELVYFWADPASCVILR